MAAHIPLPQWKSIQYNLELDQTKLVVPNRCCMQENRENPSILRFMPTLLETTKDSDFRQIQVIQRDYEDEPVYEVIFIYPLTKEVRYLRDPGADDLSGIGLSQLLVNFFNLYI
jgi:hypothetical protein